MFGPLYQRKDGTYVFASPIENGHVNMTALSDLGFWARYTFDHRAETSAKDLEIASDIVGWDYLVETFTKVTGQPAVFIHQSLDEWWNNFVGVDKPVANERGVEDDGSTTTRQNFSGFWRQWRDDVITRDLDWIRIVNPRGHRLESWMRETGYTGKVGYSTLKNAEDGKGNLKINLDRVSQL